MLKFYTIDNAATKVLVFLLGTARLVKIIFIYIFIFILKIF